MHKLIIQIPCLNEAATLPVTLADLPRQVDGFDIVEWLVIDDGSTDDTVNVARAHGVDHIVSMRHNSGLAKAFMAGLEACLHLGANVIVNTDADNQYDGRCIADLTAPVVRGESDIVIGARPITKIAHFAPIKKALQLLGSLAVRVASKTSVPDAPSGFRAIHRDAAIRLIVYNPYTYTLETIIQAGRNGMRISSVPVSVNGDMRESRLVKSIGSYVARSIGTIFRIFLIYRPFRVFVLLALVLLLPAFALGVRYLVLLSADKPGDHIQSLILAGILFTGGFVSMALAIISELLAVNRTLLEEIRVRLLKSELAAEYARTDSTSTNRKPVESASHKVTP